MRQGPVTDYAAFHRSGHKLLRARAVDHAVDGSLCGGTLFDRGWGGIVSIVVLSQRGTSGGLADQLAFSAWHEAEDVLVDCKGASLALLDRHGKNPRVRARRIAGRAVRRLAGRSVLLPAAQRGVSTDIGDAEHLVFVGHGPWDVPLLERLRVLRRQAHTVSLWLPEIWPTQLSDPRIRYEGYAMIDHLFLGVPETMEPFQALAPTTEVHYVPPATDVMAFGGGAIDGRRSIAVLGIGRRHPDQHNQILDWAAKNHALYLYDTVSGKAHDWKAHRRALSDWYRHANIAICNYGKHDQPSLIGGLRVLPGRFFEGMAAGSVMIGMAPSIDEQRRLLGVDIVESTEDTDLVTVLDKYHDPATARPIRIRNMALACRGHDWAHRWKIILEHIGVPVPESLDRRIETLTDEADRLESL